MRVPFWREILMEGVNGEEERKVILIRILVMNWISFNAFKSCN